MGRIKFSQPILQNSKEVRELKALVISVSKSKALSQNKTDSKSVSYSPHAMANDYSSIPTLAKFYIHPYPIKLDRRASDILNSDLVYWVDHFP